MRQKHSSQQSTNLFRQVDGGIVAGDTGDPVVEVPTTGRQDRSVHSKTGVSHLYGQITQEVLLPLVVEALEKVAAVHCRLEGEH